MILVANKKDSSKKKVVTIEEGETLAEMHKWRFYSTSAKKGEKCSEVIC